MLHLHFVLYYISLMNVLMKRVKGRVTKIPSMRCKSCFIFYVWNIKNRKKSGFRMEVYLRVGNYGDEMTDHEMGCIDRH